MALCRSWSQSRTCCPTGRLWSRGHWVGQGRRSAVLRRCGHRSRRRGRRVRSPWMLCRELARCVRAEEVVVHTEQSDKGNAIRAARRENACRARNTAVLTSDFDRNGGSTWTCLDAMSGGELDKISHADTSVCLDRLEVSTQPLEPQVLVSRALVGKDQRAIARAVEAIME